MKKYYHGTSYYSAYRILKEGFRSLSLYGQYGVKGSGIYITDSLRYALMMAHSKTSVPENKACIIECAIKLDGPILWSKKEYELKVIRYLKKEFSKKITEYNYDIKKIIPKNKNLTKKEAINLVNFWHEKESKKRLKQRNEWFDEKQKGDSTFIENTRQLLSYHGFSGWGQYTHESWDSDEIVVFNPSNVIPLKVWSAEGSLDKENLFEDAKLVRQLILDELKIGYEKEKEDMKKCDEKYGENLSADMYK